ncbi:hypothetical protein [Aquabacterium sp. OR-4]|uniref:hypothetical protein n=1 Tax=Aquabacterium sp. OR-4 TaxID=2978127 RepID=UPI0021B31B9C|nr:hypothetical protein [Aquabacterium sp. OR-4]MDT7837241.1 hypothetical protein [Aquabacterium sp. OR-4]
MSHAIRSLALAAAVAVLAPMSAQAAALTSLNVNLANNGSVKDGDEITSLAPGVTVSGAEVFIDNGDIGLTFSGSGPIVIKIDSSQYNLNALTFSRFSEFDLNASVNGIDSPELSGTSNGAWVVAPLLRNCDPGNNQCNPVQLTDGNDPWITEVTFSTTAIDFAGFNNLSFTQIGSNSVPEPAGYGLAAMALLAAGAASRRRSAR